MQENLKGRMNVAQNTSTGENVTSYQATLQGRHVKKKNMPGLQQAQAWTYN